MTQSNCNQIKFSKEDDITRGSLSSDLNSTSSQVPLTDYKTFSRDTKPPTSLSIHSPNTSDGHVHHSHQRNSFSMSDGRKRALRDFFTVLALSFHAIFEGLAIGLESSSSDIWILFVGM